MVRNKKPLSGKKILILRPRKQSKEIADQIRLYGGKPLLLPMIKIRTLFDENEFNEFLAKLSNGEVDYVVFMSVNGVKSLLLNAERFSKISTLVKTLKKSIIVAVGERTAQYLEHINISTAIVPKEFSSQGVAREFLARNIRGKSIYVLRTTSSNDYLKEQFQKSGALLHEYYVYQTEAMPRNSSTLQNVTKQLLERKIWAVAFTSPSTVRNFLILIGNLSDGPQLISSLNQIVVAAIGLTTLHELQRGGISVTVVPTKHTSLELVLSLVMYATYSRKTVKSD